MNSSSTPMFQDPEAESQGRIAHTGPGDFLQKIVSGAQTGADRAALDTAIRYGFPIGGWCPKGRKAEDGIIGGQYPLRETPSAAYLQRTEWNVRDSDGTVVFSPLPELTGGSAKTLQFARKHSKPFVHIHKAIYRPISLLHRFIAENQIRTLNVAGSRESKSPGTYNWVITIIEEALFWHLKNPNRLGGTESE